MFLTNSRVKTLIKALNYRIDESNASLPGVVIKEHKVTKNTTVKSLYNDIKFALKFTHLVKGVKMRQNRDMTQYEQILLNIIKKITQGCCTFNRFETIFIEVAAHYKNNDKLQEDITMLAKLPNELNIYTRFLYDRIAKDFSIVVPQDIIPFTPELQDVLSNTTDSITNPLMNYIHESVIDMGKSNIEKVRIIDSLFRKDKSLITFNFKFDTCERYKLKAHPIMYAMGLIEFTHHNILNYPETSGDVMHYYLRYLSIKNLGIYLNTQYKLIFSTNADCVVYLRLPSDFEQVMGDGFNVYRLFNTDLDPMYEAKFKESAVFVKDSLMKKMWENDERLLAIKIKEATIKEFMHTFSFHTGIIQSLIRIEDFDTAMNAIDKIKTEYYKKTMKDLIIQLEINIQKEYPDFNIDYEETLKFKTPEEIQFYIEYQLGVHRRVIELQVGNTTNS